MSDEEMLRTSGLILTDEQGKTGLTLAAILLFGTDNMIASACAHHKTDCICRVYNLDRYDDRDVIDPTNLLDSYERMFDFGQKHLNDQFVLDGIQRVSTRDAILREIISNSLAHRDYSNGYVAKMLIEKDRILMENGNRAHGVGALSLVHSSLSLRIRQFPRYSEKLDLPMNLAVGCETATSIRDFTALLIQSLSRGTSLKL
ncbi:MAG: hypothetical protein IJ523_10275 [Succinivibrionaceae bacterium]|nr:hypothetical protein [Succinivibrionaceae bacterium]